MTNRPDLRAVLEHYHVEIRSERRELQILCPIHDESRPSCSVNFDKGVIHCMSCGFGGDSFDIIKNKEGLDDFGAVVRFAEESLGFRSEGVSRPARGGRGSAGLSRGKGAFRPGYRNSPVRHRPLSAS